MKYLNSQVVFEEVPDEITLAINITNCPHRCLECHSPELRKDIGEELNEKSIKEMLEKNPYISCICFMGGDRFHKEIAELAKFIKERTGKYVAMYSGDIKIDENLVKILDYYKIGPYKKEFGPLNKETTNQKMFRISANGMEDITYKFWKTKDKD